MTLLPIVDRELRVAARPATHWLRCFAALAALSIWLLLALSTPQCVPFREIASGPLSKQVRANRANTMVALGLGQRLLNSARP